MAGKLTAKTVEALTAKGRPSIGRHTDGDGLHLHVRADGRAGWVLRYRLHGRQRDMSLGGFPDVSLKAAREAADAARQSIKAGQDPIRERQRETATATEAASPSRTFKAAMEGALAAREGTWKNAKHAWQWKATMEKHALPILGDLPVSAVALDDVLRVLRPIWAKTPETASRLRNRIETVLDYAHALKWRQGENPARWRGNLAPLLPAPSKLAPEKHHPSLPWSEVPAFLVELRGKRGMAALALEFCILTAARTGEVRGATWQEIDFRAGVWTVPAERMKAKELHIVPLSEAALDVLRRVRPDTPRPRGTIFPNAAGNPLSDMALTMLVRGMATDGLGEDEPARWRDRDGRVAVPHGFRTSFKGWSRSKGQGWQDRLTEKALAHKDENKVRGAYDREHLVEERRAMMDAWGAFCTTPPAVVVNLAEARARQAG